MKPGLITGLGENGLVSVHGLPKKPPNGWFFFFSADGISDKTIKSGANVENF